jgi:4-amino-4-deoxy-L-arabinose transferase-like glycosyltransferase
MRPPGSLVDRVMGGTSRLGLGLPLALALVLRLMWWLAYVDVIENEGAAYARLAQSLVSGDGMIGIFGGRDVMLPPLFPAAIGLVSMVAGNEEVAGRVISMLCGTALVGVLYALTSHVFNARTAIVVATLAAVHPLLIALSVSLYSEMPWIFLTVCVAYVVVRSFTYVTTGQPLVAGLIAGLAYLVRPEGFAFIVYFAVALLVVGALQRCRPIQIARTTSLFLAASLIVAAPHIVYLSWLAGTFRWEGKSAYNNVQNERVRGGMTVREAGRGLDSNGSPTGVFLGLHLDQAAQLRQPNASAASLAGTLLADPVGRMQRIVRHTLTSGFISAPWIFGLAFIGVVLVPWWRTRAWEGSTLLGISLLQGLRSSASIKHGIATSSH